MFLDVFAGFLDGNLETADYTGGVDFVLDEFVSFLN